MRELFCVGKKFLVYNLVSRNLKIKYRRSIFGVFWTLLNPMGSALTYYFVFKVVFHIQIPHYLVFILTGVFPWTFFAQSVTEGMESLVGNFGLISKIPIPFQIFPMVGTLTNFVTLLLATPVLLGAMLFTQSQFGWAIFLAPLLLLGLFVITFCISTILSVGFIFFRDLRHLITIVMQLWFYATPVIYSETMMPEKYRWVFFVNPVGSYFIALRRVVIDGAIPTLNTGLCIVGWTLAFLLLALFVSRKSKQGLVENI